MIAGPATAPAAGATGNIASILQGAFELPATTPEGGVSPEAAGFEALLAMLGLPADDGDAAPETATADANSDTAEGDTDKSAETPFQSPEALAAALASGVAAVLALAAKPAEAANAPASQPAAPVTPAIATIQSTLAALLPAAKPTEGDQPAKPEAAAAATPAIATLFKMLTKNFEPPKAPTNAAPLTTPADTPDAPAPLPVAPAIADVTLLTAIPLAAPVAPVDGTAQLTPAAPALAPATGEVVIQHHLDLARDGVWLDQLARDIARMAGNEGHLRFQLNPEHLGSLNVEVATAAGGTAIRLTADTDAARSIIADAQPRLVAEARAQGLRISETHVDLGGQMAGQNHGRQPTSDNQQPFLRTNTVNVEKAAESPASPSAAERYA